MGILGTGLQDGLLLKPIKYQWAMDLYDQAVANTWFPNEIQLGEDIADFKKMTDEERHAVTFLMSYFNPNELLVNKALAFGVYPYVSAAECSLYLAKQMWGRPTTACRSSTSWRRSRSTARPRTTPTSTSRRWRARRSSR